MRIRGFWGYHNSPNKKGILLDGLLYYFKQALLESWAGLCQRMAHCKSYTSIIVLILTSIFLFKDVVSVL
jgi:hypothetical protein